MICRAATRLLLGLALLLMTASSAFAALALDGSAWTLGATNCSPCTIDGSGTLTTTAAGIVYVVVTANSQLPTGVTGCSLTFTQRTQGGSGTTTITSYYAVSAGALSACTLTVTFASPPSFFTAYGFGVSGADTATIFDSNITVPTNGTSATLSLSTDNANDFIIGAYRFSSTATPTSGTGFTQIGSSTNGFTLAEYKIVSTTQSALSLAIGTGAGNQDGGVGDAIIAGASAAGVPCIVGGGLIGRC